MAEVELGEPEYLCYRVIFEYKNQHGYSSDLFKTAFFKLCYIANEKLLEKDVDVGLPVYWYRFGGIIDTVPLETSYYYQERISHGDSSGKSVVLNQEYSPEDFEIDEDKREIVDEVVSEVVSEYSTEYGVELPQDRQYEEFAPNDFVRNFHAFRDFLDDLDPIDKIPDEEYVSGVEVGFQDIVGGTSEKGDDVALSDEDKRTIREFLDSLLQSFPEEEYTRMDDLFLEWEHLTWQLAKNDMGSQLYNFLDDFWKAFSKVELRLRHQQNIPLHRRKSWSNEIDEEISDFRSTIQDYREVVQNNRSSTSELDDIAESFSDSVRDISGISYPQE